MRKIAFACNPCRMSPGILGTVPTLHPAFQVPQGTKKTVLKNKERCEKCYLLLELVLLGLSSLLLLRLEGGFHLLSEGVAGFEEMCKSLLLQGC